MQEVFVVVPSYTVQVHIPNPHTCLPIDCQTLQIQNSCTNLGAQNLHCCNPNLGLATKARAYKGTGQEGSPRVTSHAPKNVRECEGMNPLTPKGAPTLGIRVPTDSRIFKEKL